MSMSRGQPFVRLGRAVTYWSLAIGALILSVGLAPTAEAQTWGLVWSDEFDASGAVNASNWTYDVGNGSGGWGNNELEYYQSGTANASQAGGALTIQARRQSVGGMAYTSARIKTQGLRSFGPYGKIEARLRGPMGQGLWPAFWMLGTNIGSVGWPGCGEIDIMEHVNNAANSLGTIHWNDPNGVYAYYTAANSPVTFNTWNTYGIEWTSSYIRWLYNGVNVGEANILNSINGTDEFHRSFFMLLNLAVGGNLPGSPDASTVFPANFDVDYVRYYQAGAATATPSATATPTATPTGATPTPTSGGGACPVTWAPNVYYAAGALVGYGGNSYRCLQAHTSLPGWEPPNVPALWSLQGSCSGSVTPTPTATPTATAVTPTPPPTSTPRATATATATPTATATATTGGWNLVWSDEFNGSGAPNPANWNYHVGNGYNTGASAFAGWGNGEWEWYRPDHCTQSGGNLVIRADDYATPTSIAGRDWYQQSCRITTQGKRSWTYGRIEARISAPSAAGAWPAFWMMGDSSGGTFTGSTSPAITYYDTMATNWASCGEIDIMEKRNYETINFNNIFWDLRTGVFPWTDGQNANYASSTDVGDMTQFKVYALEWDPAYIRWFVDGVQTHVIDITPATLEEFHKPLYIIMNLAVAGAFPAMDPNPAEFPLTMRVDYVRVYQK